MFNTKILISLVLFLFATIASATENITIIYGFSASDNSANYARAIVNEANKIQDKYTFLFDVKPGAGQAIAVNHVKNTPNTILMVSGGAFFIRPNFYPKESYNVNDFKVVMTQCKLPFTVASSKYNDWKSVPTTKPLTIATSGLGVSSHLTALEIIKVYPNMRVIPYKSTTEALVATMSGEVDFAVGFVGDTEQFTSDSIKNKLTLIGVTGPKSVGSIPTLTSQGFPKILDKLNPPYSMIVPKTWDNDKVLEIKEILLKAEKVDSVRKFYSYDYCEPFHIPDNKLQSWFDEQNALWSGLTVGVKID
jgi:tripartite-type tricarboxylate transporter receptor subunit TctC